MKSQKLVFGLSFNIPVFVVLLNFAGVVKGKQLAAYRPWIVIGTFVFAAAATPSTDPFSMCLMAVPMMLLFFASEVIARLNDVLRKAVAQPEARERFAQQGYEIVGSTPEQFGTWIRSESDKWGKIIREIGVRAE